MGGSGALRGSRHNGVLAIRADPLPTFVAARRASARRRLLVEIDRCRQGIALTADGVLELAHPAAEGAPERGQLLRSYDEQCDDEHDHELHRSYRGHVVLLLLI